MRGPLTPLCICVLLPLVAFAQEVPQSSVAPLVSHDQNQSFIVELTEIEDWIRHHQGLERKLDAKELIRASRKEGSDRRRNILRVSAVEGIESYAQFGSQIPVVVSTTTRTDGTEYGYEDENVGTEIRVTITRFGKAQFQVELSFASSDVNLRPDGTEEDVDVITATATHTVALGEPVVVVPSQQYTRVVQDGQSETTPRNSSVLILSVNTTEQGKAANRSTQNRGN